jgi:hypothetical protein
LLAAFQTTNSKHGSQFGRTLRRPCPHFETKAFAFADLESLKHEHGRKLRVSAGNGRGRTLGNLDWYNDAKFGFTVSVQSSETCKRSYH